MSVRYRGQGRFSFNDLACFVLLLLLLGSRGERAVDFVVDIWPVGFFFFFVVIVVLRERNAAKFPIHSQSSLLPKTCRYSRIPVHFLLPLDVLGFDSGLAELATEPGRQ